MQLGLIGLGKMGVHVRNPHHNGMSYLAGAGRLSSRPAPWSRGLTRSSSAASGRAPSPGNHAATAGSATTPSSSQTAPIGPRRSSARRRRMRCRIGVARLPCWCRRSRRLPEPKLAQSPHLPHASLQKSAGCLPRYARQAAMRRRAVRAVARSRAATVSPPGETRLALCGSS